MVSVAPRLPLVLLLITAACIMVGGVALSRREQVVRIPQEREPLRKFAAALQKELLQLEKLHEGHLDDLSGHLAMGDPMRTQQECAAIAGLVECSFLPRTAGPPEEYVRLASIPYGAYPRPTFEAPSLQRSDFRVLDRTVFTSASGATKGWLEEPGWPLMYWNQSRRPFVIFFTIEAKDVQAAMNGWIAAWLQEHPDYRSLLHGNAELLNPRGDRLAAAPDSALPSEPAHWSQMLPTRYGSWQLAYWDRMETITIHHRPTLAVATVLSTLVALMGCLGYVQQRRAHHLAAQRVSFVNRVSHELRTPLTNMLLNLDVIEDSVRPDTRAASRLVLVKEETRRLARLIENVLTFSRREQGTIKIHAVACGPRGIVDDVLSHFTPGFARRDITVTRLHEGSDASCLLDADALSQITANLLSNVEKYAPGVPVRIHTSQGEGRFILSVCDEGPGIPAADAGRIFQPFVRLDDRVTAGVTGTGLGLSIARELAERMGGSLRLECRNAGACFILDVPLAEASQLEENPMASSSSTVESTSP